MDRACPYCGALYWRSELYPSPSTREPSFELCCRTGCVPPHPLPQPPRLLRHYFCSNTPQAKLFRRWIRLLNSSLAYTSIGCRRDPRLRPHEALYIFQLQGAIYHLQGPLDGVHPSYAQLYFMDMESALATRLHRYPLLRNCPVVLQKLDQMLRRHNPFHAIFFRARDFLRRHPDQDSIRLNPQLQLIPNSSSRFRFVYPPSPAANNTAERLFLGVRPWVSGYSQIE
jgi:hypothetical protein